jgi:hypothetical protein
MDKTFQSYHFGKSLDEPITVMMIGQSKENSDYILYTLTYNTNTFRQREKFKIIMQDPDINKCIETFKIIVEEARHGTS